MALLHQQVQMIGVEIGEAEMADPALGLQLAELAHGVEIGRMLEHPPMQLQEIDPLGLQPVQAALDAGAHDLGRHLARRRAPLGEDRGGFEFTAGDAFLVLGDSH